MTKPAPTRGLARFLVGPGVLLLSTLIGLAAVEVGARLLAPRYRAAAEGHYDRDDLLIKSRKPNFQTLRVHSDTGVPHPLFWNARGARQHRDISDENLDAATVFGIFGDSFTENVGMAGPHGFTEVFDYLLNTSGKRFEVLNFGVAGYGTDQSYLSYHQSDVSQKLDHVVYLLCWNDLSDIHENSLFEIDDSGRLIRRPVSPSPWWVRVLSRLHTTYLFLDIGERLKISERMRKGGSSFVESLEPFYAGFGGTFTAHDNQLWHQRVQRRERHTRNKAWDPGLFTIDQVGAPDETEDHKRAVEIFLALIKAWRVEVEARGATFSIALLPADAEASFRRLIPADFRIIDLREHFRARIPDYEYEDIRFANDSHWNEAGNLQAGTSLYRVYESLSRREPLPETEIEELLYVYYRAFPEYWQPQRWVRPGRVASQELLRLRERYIPLELAAGVTTPDVAAEH